MIVDNSSMYRTVKSSNFIRKNILTTGMSLIEIMRNYETIKQIRQEKHRVMQILANEVQNTENLIEKFYNLIPKTKKVGLHSIKIPPQIKKQALKKDETPSKVDALQKELFDLKAKLDIL